MVSVNFLLVCTKVVLDVLGKQGKRSGNLWSKGAE
jgi:hypothetical protein